MGDLASIYSSPCQIGFVRTARLRRVAGIAHRGNYATWLRHAKIVFYYHAVGQGLTFTELTPCLARPFPQQNRRSRSSRLL